jgi:hypothetical protein
MSDPNQKPKLHIDISGIDSEPSDKAKGEGTVDDCINCHEEIISTGIRKMTGEDSHYGGGPSTPYSYNSYIWVHAATSISKCATGPYYAAGNKRPPQ